LPQIFVTMSLGREWMWALRPYFPTGQHTGRMIEAPC
jgi:hypothetical protein